MQHFSLHLVLSVPCTNSHFVSWKPAVWFKFNISKHTFIFWLMVRRRPTTRDKLRSWGMNVPQTCLFCGTETESLQYLFFFCEFSTTVWEFFFLRSTIIPPSRFEDILNWCVAPTSSYKLNLICKLLLQATVYELWKQMNSKLHTSSLRPPNQIIKYIQQILIAKLAILDQAPWNVSPNFWPKTAIYVPLVRLLSTFSSTAIIVNGWCKSLPIYLDCLYVCLLLVML